MTFSLSRLSARDPVTCLNPRVQVLHSVSGPLGDSEAVTGHWSVLNFLLRFLAELVG